MTAKKLTDKQIAEIRRRVAEKDGTQGSIAIEFGVSQSQISKIKADQIYKYSEESKVSVLEKDVEKAFVKRIQDLGGTAEKFTSPGRRSVPDRLCMMPGGILFFVELKAPGKAPTPKQRADHTRRRAMGFDVYIVSTMEGARAFTPRPA